ncbi:MAG: hypothetical protein M1399_08935 [Actinobacteria bacterium]|nr:hypothetical protein [Actinomycetota bacterium]
MAPAIVSREALTKAARKRNANGDQVCGFREFLDQLGTLTRPGCTTLERLPLWVREVASATHRNPALEILAEHIRQHLGREMSRRSYAASRS